MSSLKAGYINELYKISKKKKIIVAAILSVASVVVAGIIVGAIDHFSGIRLVGGSEFSLLVLTVLSYTLIPLFTAFICIDMFSGEFSNNTIKLTVTRPISRLKVYLSKVLAAATFILVNLFFVMLASFIASLLVNGTNLGFGSIAAAYLTTFFPIFTFAMIVMFISNFSRGSASAFLISIVVFLLFIGLEWAFPKYQSFLFTSSLDWYNLFLGEYINWQKIIRIFFILAGYILLFFSGGYLLFEKRDI